MVANDEAMLLRKLVEGDEAALRVLMDRYDRLVRYTIFRTAREQCVRDPQWLDAVAVDAWNGFLQSARRGSAIETGIARYLTGVARQQAITALRRAAAFARQDQRRESTDSLSQLATADSDPAGLAANLELLAALRECAALLPEEDQLVMGQLSAITQRRWVEAATTLGLSESTIRSKWGRILDRLRICMEKKGK